MVTKNIVKLQKSLVEVTVTVPWSDVAPKWGETLQRLSADIELPGFRKGQAPANMVQQSLGNKLQDEALKVICPQALIEALQGSNIVPIDYPKYQLISLTPNQQLIFKATITERPNVQIGNYKSISAQRPVVKQVTDDDVNKLVDDLYKRWKAKNPVNSPQPTASSQNSEAPNQNGLGQATGSINFNQSQVTSPAPQVLSDTPDDNFARAVGAQSLEDLKTKIKADLENEAKYNNELDFEELILQEVEKMTTVDVPEILIGDELNRMLVSLQRRVADMGLLLEDYLKGQGKTLEGIKNEWRAQAEKNVRMELGLAEIARAEKVEITDTELQTEIDKIQDGKLKAQFESQEPRLHLKHSLRQIRTLDLLKGLVKSA